MADNIIPPLVAPLDLGLNPFEGLPALLANPALLDAIGVTAQALGTTYNNIIDQITTHIQGCEQSAAGCYGCIAENIAAIIGDATLTFNQILDLVKQDITGCSNTMVSSADNTINDCSLPLDQALKLLKPGELAYVDNCFPTEKQFGIQPVAYSDWISNYLPYYALDSAGTLIAGARLDDKWTWHFRGDKSVNVKDDDALNTLLSYNSLFPPPEGYKDSKCGVHLVNCGVLTSVATGKVGVDTATQQTSTVINDIIAKIPPPIVSVPVRSQATTDRIFNQYDQYVKSAPECPQPIVNVNVSPTPVTINVQPCTPVSPALSDNVQPGNFIVESKQAGAQDAIEFSSNLVEEFILDVGYPKVLADKIMLVAADHPEIFGLPMLNLAFDDSIKYQPTDD